MREIKFRAWDGRQMYKQPKIPYSYINLGIEESGLEIMQYTGLKDKNGVEIYEGDIVRPLSPPMSKKYRVIKWGSNGAKTGFNISNGKANEVIGNIYEHPELLKEAA